MIQAGRGFGKTRSGAEAVSHYLHEHPGCRVALVGPTWRDVRDTMVEGESGLLAVMPPAAVSKWNASLGELVLANGARCFAYAATQPDRLRGPQHHFAWGDEVAAWERPETWDQLLLGLRLGKNPQVVLTTTPKPRKLVRDIIKHPRCVVTKGSTYDNLDNLPPEFAAAVLEAYRGSRLGRQEIEGELLEDVEGALWTLDGISRDRVAAAPELRHVVVAIDPAGGGSDEVGIVAAGRDADGHAYVLADRSGRFHPEQWARRAIGLYHELEADRIVVERNYGGDMVTSTLRAVDTRLQIVEVVASRGKRVRAEPIATAYEQGKVHHVGVFEQLEEQMCTWTPDSGDSPDRMDALVWALTDVMQKGQGAAFMEFWKATTPALGEGQQVSQSLKDQEIRRQIRQTEASKPSFAAPERKMVGPRCLQAAGHRWRGDTCVFCGGLKAD